VEVIASIAAQSATPGITAGGPLNFCENDNVQLTSDKISGNQWYKDGQLIPGATSTDYFAYESGDYTVIHTAIAECPSVPSNIMTVIVEPIPVLSNLSTVLTTGHNQLFSFTPTCDIPGTSFSWVRGQVDEVSTPANSGIGNISETLTLAVPSNGNQVVVYGYTLTSPNGCTNIEPESVIVTIIPPGSPRMITSIIALPPPVILPGPAALEVKAMPNPSTSDFSLQIKSNSNNPVTVRILNANGRLMEQKEKITSNSTVKFGEGWVAGLYYAEVIQGDQRKLVKLVKVN
jgi:hypothetical protein